MAWRSSGGPASWIAAVALAGVALAAPRRAAAECEGDFAFTLVDSHLGVVPEPTAADGLGVELWVRGPSGTWGKGCLGGRHRLDVVESEAPSYGDRDRVATRLVRYSYTWHVDDLTLHAGAAVATLWGDNLRFLTPVIGVAGEPGPDVVVRARLESAGVFAFALDRVPRTPGDDLTLAAEVVWPARATVRGELRGRARRYNFAGKRVDDVTATAGLGLALAARDRQRAIPVFAGLSYRQDDAGRAVLLGVLEVGFGLGAW